MQQPQERPAHDHVLVSPIWLLIVRIFQFVVSLIILGLAAALMHDAYLDEEGLALAISIITWLVVAYTVFSERVPALRSAYHVVAVLVLDGVMVILWLATFAAVAARRAKFKYRVRVSGCVNDGSLLNSEFCFRKRDELSKRDVILFKRGQDELAAIAGLGAIVWLLFIASFAWTIAAFLKGRREGRFQFNSQPTQVFQMEPKLEQQTQQLNPSPQPQPQPQPPHQPVSPLPTNPQPYQTPQAQYPVVPYAPPQPIPYPPQEQEAYAGGQYPVHQPQQFHQPPYQASPPPAAVSPPPDQQP